MGMIGYGRQQIDEDDIAAVEAVLRSDFLTCGPAIPAFESALAAASGQPHAVAAGTGTSALRLLYQAVGIGPGTRIGVPDITFLATASQAMMLGAEVVLLDVDPDTGLLTPKILEACSAPLDWVVPVHLCGRLCDMPTLADIAQRRGIRLLEDAAHALGSHDATWRPGDLSDGAILSFHPVKNITTGEGGAILTRDAALAQRMANLRHHGIERQGTDGPLAQRDGGAPWYHEFHHVSGNERLSDLQAALGTSQLTRLDAFKAERAAIVERYRRVLAPLPPCTIAPLPASQSPFWHLAPLLVDWQRCRGDRRDFFAVAREAGFALQVHYIPLHAQPVCRHCQDGDYPGAMAWYDRQVSLPCFPGLEPEDQRRLCDLIRDFCADPS